MKDLEKPLLIITSGTRNYGWVTRAFLEYNTRWADYIVIVDQMSTDSTRPLIQEYNNRRGDGKHQAEIVIIDDPDMAYKENIRAKKAFLKGRELAAGRDAIYFALDIDEVMPANWQNTEDGKRILISKPGDMFELYWANVLPDNKTYHKSVRQYRVFHDNGMEWQDASIQMHTPLLPYSSWDEKLMNAVCDFPLIHFGPYHHLWIRYKTVYYQMLDIHQHKSNNPITIFRTYHKPNNPSKVIMPLEKEWLYNDINIFELIDLITTPIFIEYISELIKQDGLSKFVSLDIWYDDMLEALSIRDIRPSRWKILHYYLNITRPYSRKIWCRAVDKVLKYITRF